METSIVIDAEHNCVFIRRTGAFERGGLNQVVQQAMELPEFRRGMNFLIDLRLVDFSEAGFTQLSGYGDVWREIAKSIAPCRIAVLHSSPRNFGIGRQSAALFEAQGVERRPFGNLGEALLFLGLPADFELPAKPMDRDEAC